MARNWGTGKPIAHKVASEREPCHEAAARSAGEFGNATGHTGGMIWAIELRWNNKLMEPFRSGKWANQKRLLTLERHTSRRLLRHDYSQRSQVMVTCLASVPQTVRRSRGLLRERSGWRRGQRGDRTAGRRRRPGALAAGAWPFLSDIE